MQEEALAEGVTAAQALYESMARVRWLGTFGEEGAFMK
jgi:hypothetical protein